MLELYVWIFTLFSTGIAHILLALKWGTMKPETAAVAYENARFSRRLNWTNATNYISFGFLAIFCIIFYSQYIETVKDVLRSWWVVEVFILWNLRTTALILFGLKKIKVNL